MNCRIRMSFRLLGIPQRKKSPVIRKKADRLCFGTSDPSSSVLVVAYLVERGIKHSGSAHHGEVDQFLGEEEEGHLRCTLIRASITSKLSCSTDSTEALTHCDGTLTFQAAAHRDSRDQNVSIEPRAPWCCGFQFVTQTPQPHSQTIRPGSSPQSG